MIRHHVWIGLLLSGALGLSLGLCLALLLDGRVEAQAPGPTPAQLEERLRATDRTLTIIRERELEMTRLVALYANRLDEAQKELAQVRAQLETPPPCPTPPTTAEGEKR